MSNQINEANLEREFESVTEVNEEELEKALTHMERERFIMSMREECQVKMFDMQKMGFVPTIELLIEWLDDELAQNK